MDTRCPTWAPLQDGSWLPAWAVWSADGPNFRLFQGLPRWQRAAQPGPLSAAEPGGSRKARPCPLVCNSASCRAPWGGSSFVGPWSQLTPLPDPAALITQMLHSSEASPTQTLSPHLLQRGHPGTSRSELAVSMWSDLEDTLLIYTLVTFPFRLSFRFLFCNTSNKCLPI